MRHSKPSPLRIVKALVTLLLVLGIGFGAGSLIARIALDSGLGTLPQAETGSSDDTSQGETTSPGATSPIYHAWNQEDAPNYYRVLGPAVVGDQPEPGTARYGEPDARGRTTAAVAVVTRQSMEDGLARQRDDISTIEPSGWGHNQEVDIAMPDGTVYHGFLFNRSHLIAKSLGGDDATHNLVTGTRTQNVGANVGGTEGGMAYGEGLVRSWLFAHPDGWVYYAASPAYEGNELVARSIIVDIRSSNGELDQRVDVFNAACGYEVDYATGSFTQTMDSQVAAEQIRQGLGLVEEKSGDSSDDEASITRSAPTGSSEPEDGERKVIVTRSDKAYHHDETCSGLANALSMQWVTVSEAEEMGRHPCGICGG